MEVKEHDQNIKEDNVVTVHCDSCDRDSDIPELEEIGNQSTALVKVKPELDLRVIGLAKEIDGLRTYAIARIIANDTDLAPATDDLSLIAKVKKSLDEYRKEYLKPLKAHIDDVNNAFKVLSDPLDEADQITRQKIMAYRAEIARKQTEAEAINRAKEELAKREIELKGQTDVDTTPVEAPAQVKHIYTDMGTIGMTKVWKFEVVDFSLLPDRFKMENATLIGKVVRAGEREIPGVRIWCEDSLRVTAK